MTAPRLQLTGISKQYPAVKANDNRLHQGALGKTTGRTFRIQRHALSGSDIATWIFAAAGILSLLVAIVALRRSTQNSIRTYR